MACSFAEAVLKRQATTIYDDFGRKLIETDPLGRTWRASWNLHGERVSTQSPVQAGRHALMS